MPLSAPHLSIHPKCDRIVDALARVSELLEEVVALSNGGLQFVVTTKDTTRQLIGSYRYGCDGYEAQQMLWQGMSCQYEYDPDDGEMIPIICLPTLQRPDDGGSQ